MPRSPEIADVRIDAVTASGDGEGMLGAVRVAVPFSIPGELVRVRLWRSRDRHEATGRIVSVLSLELPAQLGVGGRRRQEQHRTSTDGGPKPGLSA